MSEATLSHRTRFETDISSSPIPLLLQTLVNPLILDNTVPYLPVSDLLNLSATNKAFHSLIYETSRVFRHLDLTKVKTAQFDTGSNQHDQVWHNVELDDFLTEDDFYSGPLRGVFHTLSRRDVLRDVQTLVLDGLSVTAELCNDIINDPSYSVRILSIRDVKNLNFGKLFGALQYACRSTRPEGAPRLKAVYVFGSRDVVPASASSCHSSISTRWNQKSHQTLTTSLQHKEEEEAWWTRKGQMIKKHVREEWANCLLACKGIIAFDAVLCQGPRHVNSPAYGMIRTMCGPAVATYALPPCAGCGKCPEGATEPGIAGLEEGNVPVLAPPPLMSSSAHVATTPNGSATAFVPRCLDCIRERYCSGCHKWWCETCYTVPGQERPGETVILDDASSVGSFELEPEIIAVKPKAKVSKSCWECGNNCDACIEKTQKSCRKCRSGYCLTHNEGSCSDYCDWCVSRGRGLKR